MRKHKGRIGAKNKDIQYKIEHTRRVRFKRAAQNGFQLGGHISIDVATYVDELSQACTAALLKE